MNLTKINTICLDLDGTLLNSDGVVSDMTKEVLNKLVANGYKIMIATGRHYEDAKRVTAEVKGLSYLTSNGAFVVDKDGKILSNYKLNKEDIFTVLDIIDADPRLTYGVFTEEYMYIRNHLEFCCLAAIKEGVWGEFLDLGYLKWGISNHKLKTVKEVENIREHILQEDLSVHKVLVLGGESSLESAKMVIEESLGDSLKLSSSGKNIEINKQGVSKGSVLEDLMKELGKSSEEIIAFGDGGNDLELFDVAGIAVAMSNSESIELREKADFIAESNDNDGVAKVLEILASGFNSICLQQNIDKIGCKRR